MIMVSAPPRPPFSYVTSGTSNDALAVTGRRDEARTLFIDLLAHPNAFGLFSEDIHPEAGALWGKIPKTHSMAGIINSTLRLSVRWEDVWCLVSS